MTKKERETFYRLLVDLFVDNPKRKEAKEKKGQTADEIISSKASNRPAEPNRNQATTN
jgi:hypothetical protein